MAFLCGGRAFATEAVRTRETSDKMIANRLMDTVESWAIGQPSLIFLN
jgi:hypothetical protein